MTEQEMLDKIQELTNSNNELTTKNTQLENDLSNEKKKNDQLFTIIGSSPIKQGKEKDDEEEKPVDLSTLKL